MDQHQYKTVYVTRTLIFCGSKTQFPPLKSRFQFQISCFTFFVLTCKIFSSYCRNCTMENYCITNCRIGSKYCANSTMVN